MKGIIVHLDEVLTMSSRLAASTGDERWERRYRKYEPLLDRAIKQAIELPAESEDTEAALQTDAANIKLVSMENRAFLLATPLTDEQQAEQRRLQQLYRQQQQRLACPGCGEEPVTLSREQSGLAGAIVAKLSREFLASFPSSFGPIRCARG